MNILFSAHARFQMKERDISESVIRKVILKPDKVADRSDEKRIAQKRVRWHNKNVLCRVIYMNTSHEAVRIITAYITTKIDKYT